MDNTMDINENRLIANGLTVPQPESPVTRFLSDPEIADSTHLEKFTTCSSPSKFDFGVEPSELSGKGANSNFGSNSSPFDSLAPEQSEFSERFFSAKEVPPGHDNIDQLLDTISGEIHYRSKVFSDEPTQDATFVNSNEEFTDAAQFFSDPSNINFLERCGKPASKEAYFPRSSLYMNFDPLSVKFSSQSEQKASEEKLDGIPEGDSLLDAAEGGLDHEIIDEINKPVNKNIAVMNASPRHSLGNVLIRFDSPVVPSFAAVADKIESDATESCVTKMYSEEEFQQALKLQELTWQNSFIMRQKELEDNFMKKPKELEESFLKKQTELEGKINRLNTLCSCYFETLNSLLEITYSLSEKEKSQQEGIDNLTQENEKLKEDLKTATEDLQSVETTFSDFHKRYEQSKSMLKVYTQNENSFRQQIESLNQLLHEKEEMYNALQAKTQEIVEQSNQEINSVKNNAEAQAAVLKAQLKKAELKISSLESDLKHVKIENGNLESICDDLMAKVSKT